MTENPDEPLRGDESWRAAKAAIAKRNDAARKRGGELRAADNAATLERIRAADARESENLPVQPRP